MPDNNTLLAPMQLASWNLSNRIALAAQITNLSEGPGMSPEHLVFYQERIDGGIAMLINDPVSVHPSSQTLRTAMKLDPANPGSYGELLHQSRSRGILALQQLTHAGAHGCAATAFSAAWSPSGLPSLRDQDGSHAMTESEIEQLLQAFCEHARQAQRLGFAGIELVAGGNALIEQFWNPLSNHRHDRWGQDQSGRMRFSTELIRRIRHTCGEQFIIGLQLSTTGGFGNTLDSAQLAAIIDWHETRAPADYYSLALTSSTPDTTELEQLALCRASLKTGRLCVAGNVLDVALAQQLVATGLADWVGLDKALLADPRLVRRLEDGTPEAIRPCVGCHQECGGRQARDYTIGCLVNPDVGFELQRRQPTRAALALRVLVAGGGLAGLEAARSAAVAGHSVTLAERTEQLGGVWRLAARQPGRARLARLLDWYRLQLNSLGVRTCLHCDAADIPQHEYDHLIIATGCEEDSRGFQRRLPNQVTLSGLSRGRVCRVEDVLTQPPQPDNPLQILLLDDIGHWSGIGTALYLAELGHTVTLISRHPVAAPELSFLPEYPDLLRRLHQLGIHWRGGTTLLEWQGDRARLASASSRQPVTEPFDALVLATTPAPDQRLERLAEELGLSFSLAGDCQGARKAHMAILEGRQAALRLGRNTTEGIPHAE